MSMHFNNKSLMFPMVLWLLFTGSSSAWQFSLSNTDGNLVQGETYAMTVEFQGDSTDYLDFLVFAIRWKPDLLELARPVDRETYAIFGPYPIPPHLDAANGLYARVGSKSNTAHLGEFYPQASGETRMATFTFTALASGYFEDLAGFYFTSQTNLAENVLINGVGHRAQDGELIIEKAAGSSILRPFYILSRIMDQDTNINTTTAPIPFTITSTESGQVKVTGASSDASLTPEGAIAIYTDDQGTMPAGSPLNVPAETPVTLYLTVTPANSLAGTATVSVIVADHNDPDKSTATDFDLTVELAEAVIWRPFHTSGETIYYPKSLITFAGTKARGSVILLQPGSDAPFEIVAADVDGKWTYDWHLADGDGQYDFSLINRAGTIEEAFIKKATVVLDTLPPVVKIIDRAITAVRYNALDENEHRVAIRAEAPVDADSSRFRLCFNGEVRGVRGAYGESNYTGIDLADGQVHQAVAIPVDQAGNEQVDCSGNPLYWFLEADHAQIRHLGIYVREKTAGDPAHVAIKLPTDASLEGVRAWAKAPAADTYEELGQPPERDKSGNYLVFKDTTTPVRMRSYVLTDDSGTDVMLQFELLEDAQIPADPKFPQDPENPGGGGSGGGGCFIDASRF